MKLSLNIVAKDIYTKIGNDLSKLRLYSQIKEQVFFLIEFLADQSENPIWSQPI